MNKTCYKQYDTRWASLPYPRKPWLIRNCGCGEVSICNCIIDMEQYKAETPKTIQPYMKQFAESRGNGTYHSGIPTAMKHYGMTEVQEHATMTKLWAELRKGGRNAVLLMGSRRAGSKGVKWTGCGHFVEVSGYKEEGGKHWVYVKDSASTSSYRNGWIAYEDNIRGACLKCWSGKLNGKTATDSPQVEPTPDGKLTIDGIGGISTAKAMQKFFGTAQDGVISGQNQSCSKWYPALKSVKYGKGGSPCIKKMQKWLGIKEDGVWGKDTSIALQKKLGVKADGVFGAGSMRAWQKYLNEHDNADYPKPKVKVTIPSAEVSIPPTASSLPTLKLVKSNAEVIVDTITWAKWIAGDNSFHYGHGKSAHHNGCYFCGTNTTSGGRSKKGIVDYKKSYCCNPFVGAAWAHGGCDQTALGLCRKGTSWDFHKGKGYDASKLFKNLGHPSKSSLKAGDVLCRNTHVALYIGNGKIVHACHEDDNKRNSAKWNSSISIEELTDAKYKNFPRVHRYVGSVSVTSMVIRYGEVSYRVKLWQKFLNSYFKKQVVAEDGIFGDGTLKYTKEFQTAKGITADGVVGQDTLNKAK